MHANDSPRFVPISRLVGCPARDRGGERFGRIDDLVFESGSDRIAFVLLSIDGFLRTDRLFAVPPRAVVADGDAATVPFDRTILKNAPALDAADRDLLGDHSWALRVYSYFGFTPYWE
jgi:hypothetical protein